MRARRGLSWPTFSVALAYLPIGVLSVPAAFINQRNNSLSVWAMAVVISIATASGIVLISKMPRPEKPILLNLELLAALAILGAARGWALSHTSQSLGLSVNLDSFEWIRNSTISTMLWVLLLGAAAQRLVGTQAIYRKRFAARTLEVALGDNSADGKLESLETLSNVSALQSNITQIAKLARVAGLSDQTLFAAASSLRAQIEHSLRPLSHRIWFNELKNQPEFRVNSIWQEGLRRLRLAPTQTGLIAAAGLFVGASSQLTLLEVSTRSILVGLLTAAALWSIEKLLPGRRALGLNLVLVLLATSAPFYVTELVVILLGVSPLDSGWIVLLLPSLGNAVLVAIISSLRQLDSDWDFVMEALEPKVTQTARLNLSLASYLHNSLQAELIQIAEKLEQIAPDSIEVRDGLISQLEAISKRGIREDILAKSKDPLGRLQEVIRGWEGIIELRIDLAQLALLSERQLSLAVEVIEEGAANAVRHAGAKFLEIEVEKTETTVFLALRNHYKNSSRIRSGLGTAWIEKFSGEPPKIRFSGGFREIKVRL